MSEMSSASRLAYAFYATCDEYAITALVAISRLRQLGNQDGIDIILLHLTLSAPVLRKMHEMGVTTRKVEPLPYYGHDQYFRDCLVKFRVLELVEYERILFLDADTFPLRDLDHLLFLEFNEEIAAPDAYWLDEPCVTSALLLLKPSVELWDRVAKHFESAARNSLYDMDILNLEFEHEIYRLPPGYFCLDSEWVNEKVPCCFGDPWETYAEVKLLHFSAFGKPWYYHPNTIRRLRPHAHPLFYRIWDEWWRTRNEILPETIREKAVRFLRETRQILRLVRQRIPKSLWKAS